MGELNLVGNGSEDVRLNTSETSKAASTSSSNEIEFVGDGAKDANRSLDTKSGESQKMPSGGQIEFAGNA